MDGVIQTCQTTVLKHSPGSSFVPFKRLNSCWLRLNDDIEVSRSELHSVDTWILSFKTKDQQKFNLLNKTIKLPDECLRAAV